MRGGDSGHENGSRDYGRHGRYDTFHTLIEHDQRSVTANLLFKLTKILDVDLETLSGDQERDFEIKLREVFADPMLGIEAVPEAEIQAIAAAAPNAVRAILALHSAWAGARASSCPAPAEC